jgi:protein-S-isoprenylcysteine O-methyltransferase Ste14
VEEDRHPERRRDWDQRHKLEWLGGEHDPVTTVLLYVTLGGWALLEVSLRTRDRVRGRGSTNQDRGTQKLIGVTLGAAIVLAIKSTTVAPSLRIPGHGGVVLAGLIVLWLGLVIRVWAVVALGSAFRTTVEVDVGQAVVRAVRIDGSGIPPTQACCSS